MSSVDSARKPSSLTPSKPFSLSLSSARPSNKPTLKPPVSTSKPTSSTAHGRKRPYSALADPDSEPEDDANGRHEAVVGFGHDGKAISVADSKGEGNQLLVIKPEKSGRDWREETRRRRGKKNLLPAEAQARQNRQMEGGGSVEHVEVSTVGGLKIAEKKIDGDGDVAMVTGRAEENGNVAKEVEVKQMTADEEAVAALLGEEKKPALIIAAVESEPVQANGHDSDEFTNEADRFRADVDSRPLPSSLADYNACPVDGFGAGILRGYGWKDGAAVGKTNKAATAPRDVQRRPALLGLGAKETPGGVSGEELGAWNQKKGRGKEKVNYNPLMLRNSKTGEMVTEEELELRKLEAKQGKKEKVDDWRERRDGTLKVDDGNKKQRLAIQNGDGIAATGSSLRDRSRDRDRDRRKHKDRSRERDHGSSRRERSRSREWDKERSSRRERDRSKDRERRRKDDDYDRRHRGTGSKRRDDDRDYDRRARERDYDDREYTRKQKRR